MEELKQLINRIDEIQTKIEDLEGNGVIQEYNIALKEKSTLVEEIKAYIKSGTTIEETEKIKFKVTKSYSYNPTLLKKKLGEQIASRYIKIEEKVDSKNIDKDIKAEIIEDVTDCKELKSISVTPQAKKDLLTEVEL